MFPFSPRFRPEKLIISCSATPLCVPLKEDVCHVGEEEEKNREKELEEKHPSRFRMASLLCQKLVHLQTLSTQTSSLYCNRTDEIIANVSHGNIFAVITPSASECRLDYLQFPLQAERLGDVLAPILKDYLFHIQTESPTGINNIQLSFLLVRNHAVQIPPCYCEDFPLRHNS